MSQRFNLATPLLLLALCVYVTTSLTAHRRLALEGTKNLTQAIEKCSQSFHHKGAYDGYAKLFLKKLDTSAEAANQVVKRKNLTALLYDAQGTSHNSLNAIDDWRTTLERFKSANRKMTGFGCYGHRHKGSKMFEYACVFDAL